MYELRSIAVPPRAATLVILAISLAAAGCKSKPAAAPQDDATLTQAVQGKLSSNTAISAEPIQSSVQQGIATLNGTVSSEAARSLAANEAAQIAGIKTVVNNLVVQAPAVQAPAVTASISASTPPPIKPEKPGRHPKPSAVINPPAPITPPAAPIQEAESAPPAPIERSTPAPVGTPPALPAAAFRAITLPADTTLAMRITQTLDSATTQPGETFSGVLASDVLLDGLVVLPQGTPVSGKVDTVQEAAHFKGNSLLTIELTSLDRRGDHLPITTDSFSKAGNGRGKNSAAKIGGGAAVGAILGGIFGGGKGAAIGAAAGGGAGAGVQAVTKGQQVQIESETTVRFRLANPVTVRVSTSGQNRDDHDDSDLHRHY